MSNVDLTTREIEILMNWSGYVYRAMQRHQAKDQKYKPTIFREMARLCDKLEAEYNSQSQTNLFSKPWDGKDD